MDADVPVRAESAAMSSYTKARSALLAQLPKMRTLLAECEVEAAHFSAEAARISAAIRELESMAGEAQQ